MAKKRIPKSFANDRELPTPKEAKKEIDRIKEDHFGKEPENKPQKVKFTTYLDKDVALKVKMYGLSKGTSAAKIINQLLKDFLKDKSI